MRHLSKAVCLGLMAACSHDVPLEVSVPNVLGEPCEATVAWYFDMDEDGFGDPERETRRCEGVQLAGHSLLGTDCDDDNKGTFPGAIEVCDGVDRDCNDRVDDNAVDQTWWHPDADEDGYGSTAGATLSCEPPDGYVTSKIDCDDSDPLSFPGADDPVCDGIDQDCDGTYGDSQIGGIAFASLQQALESGMHGVIWACPGEHALDFSSADRSVMIRGAGANDAVIVPATPGSPMLRMERAPEVYLRRLQFRGGVSTTNGGALAAHAAMLHLQDLEFVDNHSDGSGGAIALSAFGEHDWALTELTFRDNAALMNGGDVHITDVADWSGHTWDSRGARSGGDGGMLHQIGGAFVLGPLKVDDAIAQGSGGAVAVQDPVGVPTLRGMQFSDVHAKDYGGAASVRGTDVHVELRGDVESSSAGIDGGAVALRGESVRLDGALDVASSKAGRHGGGVFAESSVGTLHMTAGTLSNCQATEKGGGVFGRSVGSVDVDVSKVNDSTARHGGGVWLGAPASGAVKVKFRRGWRNVAERGSSVLVEDLSDGVPMDFWSSSLLDNSGAPALELPVASSGKARIGFLTGNTHGGALIDRSLKLSVSGDLGSGEDDNTPWDIKRGDEELRVDGRAYLTCEADKDCP